jgi:Domain of unknown function (DUF4136)
VSSTVYPVLARNTLTLALIAPVLALGLTGATASAQDVGYNAMPGTDFSKYKTYKWVRIEGAQSPDQITDAQVKSSIDGQLVSKGLTKTEDDTADLYIGYQVALDKEKQWNAYGTGGGPGWGWGRGYGYGAYGGGMATATSSTITIGTLGLDFYDRTVKQLVWRGTASKTIDPRRSPKNARRISTKQ